MDELHPNVNQEETAGLPGEAAPGQESGPAPPREIVLRYEPDAPEEIVLRYDPGAPVPIVLRYVQPTPLPGRKSRRRVAALQNPPAPRNADTSFIEKFEAAIPPEPEEPPLPRRKTRRVLISCLAALLAACLAVGPVARLVSTVRDTSPRDGGFQFRYELWSSADTAANDTTIRRYPNGENVRLLYAGGHGEKLTIQQVYERVNPCTVTVATALPDGSAIIGTGVIFTPDGYILTNAHVVSGGEKCFVVLNNGKSYSDVQLVGYDSQKDLAVIKVNAQLLPTAEFGDSDALTVGDTVYAIGNPLGVELRGTLTDGIVSAINRDVMVDGVRMTLIQTNAALNNGNSGGPLINTYGQVVGINTMKMGSSSTNSVEGLGFAIPISTAAWMVNDLIAYGELRGEPVIGITVLHDGITLPSGETALQIYEVEPGGPGETAGLQPGDCILKADDEPVRSVNDLLRVRRRLIAGEILPLIVDRGGQRFPAEVILKEASGS